ncbi:hypothetical protein CQ019_17505 [Arthrobacter sp. MYb229]|uniref:sensor histidine kinase n=1 Tax=unclassified Arthrobacter TaxID=235627 RepID=UPI000CFB2F2F|nr:MULTISPECIES: histidine kinase [unclassified Arthrobacter]PQZ98025.1 hypothetical protein CQ019_17505 [Arthrobacter sp. MYb229]PRB46907.1 hypothetical protein CQ013_17530 [Arthrobacter sp. MYb216]
MTTVSRLLRQFAWLMSGAAIATATIMVVMVLVYTVAEAPASQGAMQPRLLGAIAAGSILLGAALGLVPGVREVEVSAARTMLSSRQELVAPLTVRPAHRIQTVLWVLFHLAGGLFVASCLLIVLPLAGSAAFDLLTARPLPLGLAAPSAGPGRWLGAMLAALIALAALLSWWPLGLLAARLVGRFLGPTTHDRLQLALVRADREAEHNRIARELHDGIGHALSIVGIQAAAGRRLARRDPEMAAERFDTIESTARSAMAELDAMLAVLRGGAAAPSHTDLGSLVETHRRNGMELRAAIELPEDLPEMLGQQLAGIVAELLSNARRHGAGGEVRLLVRHTGKSLELRVENAPGAGGGRPGGGRGLLGVRERVAICGGTADIGLHENRWTARIELPLLRKGHGS